VNLLPMCVSTTINDRTVTFGSWDRATSSKEFKNHIRQVTGMY